MRKSAIFLAVCLALQTPSLAMKQEVWEAEVLLEEYDKENTASVTYPESSEKTSYEDIWAEDVEEILFEDVTEKAQTSEDTQGLGEVQPLESVQESEEVQLSEGVQAPEEELLTESAVGLESRYFSAQEDTLQLLMALDKPESELRCNVPVTFTMTPVNGSGAMGDVVEFNGQQKPRYMFLVNTVMMKDEITGEYTSLVDPTKCKYVESNQFSFTFVSPGDYYIKGYVMDFGTMPLKTTDSERFYFTISDEATLSLDEVADGIVKECLAAGCSTDYEKALYFHDWIINHSEYDNSGIYMGADGVLLRGKGTCESYYRALALLLGKVGIPSERAEGNGHVWSCVRLDGEWTQIDATWNGGRYSQSMDYMNHLYFGVTDEMIKKVHSDHEPVNSRPCTSYERNYFIRSGEISRWTDPLEKTLREKLAAGETAFTIEAEYNAYPSVYHIIYPMAAYALDQELYGERLCRVAYDSENKRFTVSPFTEEGSGSTGGSTGTGSGSTGDNTGTGSGSAGGSSTGTGSTSTGSTSGCFLGHSFTAGWKQTVAPTCTKEGKMRRTCSVCGAAEEKSVPMTSHCTTQKLANGKKQKICTVCKQVLSEQRVKVKLNVTKLPLQVKKSTKVLKVASKDKKDKVAYWSSSNRKVVQVDKKSGKITAKKAGRAYVTVTMKSGASARCLIKVQNKKVTVSKLKVSPTKVSLKKGQKLTIKTSIIPLTATDKVSYSSSNKKVASVSTKGVITAKKKGKAKVTVRAGSKKATITVTIW